MTIAVVGCKPDINPWSPPLMDRTWIPTLGVMDCEPCTTDRKTILVVDDEEEWRSMVCEHLTDAGYDVCVAADATEALVWSEEPSLGLIIVDDNLGGESGIMLTRFLRRNRPDVPTMLYTRFEYDQATILDVMNQGVDQCLPKGSMEELLVTVGCYVK